MYQFSYFYSLSQKGFESSLVQVEVNIKTGIPKFVITGLPAATIREAAERVKISIANSGFHFPLTSILVNLSPTDIKKDGSWYDLPIAAGILSASGQIPDFLENDNTILLGELGLNGSIRPIKGLLNLIAGQKFALKKNLIIPYDNIMESTIFKNYNVYPIKHLSALKYVLPKLPTHTPPSTRASTVPIPNEFKNFNLTKVQMQALRALEVAIAGRHHCLFMGSPGSGKTMLCKTAKFLQPPLSDSEGMEVLRIKSINEYLSVDILNNIVRPFRSPHHTSSDISIVGGGRELKMGEITLAHRGILFLDELGEFKSAVIQTLREPMEEGRVSIARVSGHMTFPADFHLIAAMNPCPCGYLNTFDRECTCTTLKRRAYATKISGPFLDRIEISIELNRNRGNNDLYPVNLETVKNNIEKAVFFRNERNLKESKNSNRMELEFSGKFDHEVSLKQVSPRKITHWKKIARTIADLDTEFEVREEHLLEALDLTFRKDVYDRLAA